MSTAHEAFRRALEEAAKVIVSSSVDDEGSLSYCAELIRAIPNPYPASENAAPELFAKARRWLMQKRRK